MILLHSFVIISFIKTINRTTQLHQSITFDHFEHQPITENGRSVWRPSKNDKNDIRRGKKSNSSTVKCFQANDSELSGYFT